MEEVAGEMHTSNKCILGNCTCQSAFAVFVDVHGTECGKVQDSRSNYIPINVPSGVQGVKLSSLCNGFSFMCFFKQTISINFLSFSDIIEVGGALRIQLLSLARAECADVVCVAAAAGDVSTIITFLQKYPSEVDVYGLCSL